MASPLDLRGRVIITNSASGTLNAIRRDLGAIGAMSKRTSLGSFSANALNSTLLASNKLNRSLIGLRGTMMGAGFAFGGIIAATRDFNESKFGYGFARITEFIKDGKLQLDEWKAAMNAASKEAQASAEKLSTSSDVTMRAREETEKTGARGSEAAALYKAGIGLHLSEPRALDSGSAVTFLYQVFQAYEKQRNAEAARLGIDPNDAAFQEKKYKEMAAKTAVAAASSPLGPADTVHGMQQFAPQWAALGIPFEFALSMLAHGSKYGFDASSLSTAFRSMGNKVLNPTPTAMRILDSRHIDRSAFMEMEPADPVKGTTRLNALLDGQLFAGKGGKEERALWVAKLRKAREEGRATSPEFQQELTNRAMSRLGRGWTGRQDHVRQAVSNATMTPSGHLNMPGYLKVLRDAGLTIGEIVQVFEGRHIARNTPVFEFYEKLIELNDQLTAVDGSVIDAVIDARKESAAGKTDGLIGAWKNLLVSLQDTAAVTFLTEGLTGLANVLRGMPVSVLQGLSAALIGIGAAAAGVTAFGAAAGVLVGTLRALGLIRGGAAAAAGGAAAGTAGVLGGGAAATLAAKKAANAAAERRLKRTGAETAEKRLLKGLGDSGAKAGAKSAARVGLRWIPGVGYALAAGGAAYAGYQSYQRGDGAGGIAKSTALGAIGLDGVANASEATLPDVSVDQGGEEVAAAQSAADQIKQVFASIDLSAEGQRMMASLAAGITAGGAQAIAAANGVAAGVRQAGAKVQLNTGPNMQGSR